MKFNCQKQKENASNHVKDVQFSHLPRPWTFYVIDQIRKQVLSLHSIKIWRWIHLKAAPTSYHSSFSLIDKLEVAMQYTIYSTFLFLPDFYYISKEYIWFAKDPPSLSHKQASDFPRMSNVCDAVVLAAHLPSWTAKILKFFRIAATAHFAIGFVRDR